jgi:hypothetical protein
LAKAATEAAEHDFGATEDAVRNTPTGHEVAGQDEQGDSNQQEAVHGAHHGLRQQFEGDIEDQQRGDDANAE